MEQLSGVVPLSDMYNIDLLIITCECIKHYIKLLHVIYKYILYSNRCFSSSPVAELTVVIQL